MSDLFEEVLVNSVPIPRTNLMRLEFRTGLTTDWTRPANVGYGVSYALPIIVAGLVTGKGRTLIIYSPEAHLHPRAQARIGAFLAQMAASGTQVLIETHSDHVMDGVRIAVKESRLTPDAAQFHYFAKRDGVPHISSPTIDAQGKLSEWPEGFFDQHRRNTARLLRP